MKKRFWIGLLTLFFPPLMLRSTQADVLVGMPTPTFGMVTYLVVLWPFFRIGFNFILSAVLLRRFGEKVLHENLGEYFLAILIISLVGLFIGLISKPYLEFSFRADFISRVVLSVVQIVLYPFVFSSLDLSNKKVALKVGVITVLISLIIGSGISYFSF